MTAFGSPEQLHADLSRHIEGDVLMDDVHRLLYSTAACIFQIIPAGVVIPRHTADVQNVVRVARAAQVTVTARGAGSGVAGQTLGEGIIIDFSKYMNKILEIHPQERWVRVQPGVVLADLNRELAKHDLWFPPDPSSADFCTLGGMIANNASGAHTVKYGATKDHVLELTVVLDTGEVAVVREVDAAALPALQGRWGDIARQVVPVLLKNARVIHANRPQAPKNSSGYNVWEALANQKADLNKLIVASEGTLALVVEARLRVVPKPRHRGLFRLFFDRVEHACDAVVEILKLNPSAVELIDRTLIDVIKGSVVEFQSEIPDQAESILLIEFDGETTDALRGVMKEARAGLDRSAGMMGIKEAQGGDFENLWKVRKAGSPLLDLMPGPLRSTRIIEDACVDPVRVPAYIGGLKKIFARFGVKGVIFGHAGSGNIHVNVLLNPHLQEDNDKMEQLVDEVADLVVSLKGTLSGEHGDGLLRPGTLRRVFGDLVPVFEQIKKIFDPAGTFNPGKKLAPEPYSFLPYLRGARKWNQMIDHRSPLRSHQSVLERCNGCGTCRVYCPLYLEDHDERSLPRAKANMLMAVLENQLPARSLTDATDLMFDLSLCKTCRLCLTACPSQVDAPQLAVLTDRLAIK